MQLPRLFASSSAPTEPKPLLFFAIRIGEKSVQSVLWQVSHNQLEILNTSGQHNWKDDESCISAVDASLQELGKESENVKQTLFALKEDWVNAHGIIAEKKALFQKMTKELMLEAIGFVVTAEAVTQHLMQTMVNQLSFFLIHYGADTIQVSLIKQGQVIQAQKAGRSGDGVSDLNEAFAHFKEKVFPTKLVLFSTALSDDELKAEQQKLIAQDWTKSYPFLHPPTVDTLEMRQVLEAVVHSGGRAAAEAKGLIVAAPTPEHPQPQRESTAHKLGALVSTPGAVPAPVPLAAAAPALATADEFGFKAHEPKAASTPATADKEELANVVPADLETVKTPAKPQEHIPPASHQKEHTETKTLASHGPVPNPIARFVHEHLRFIILGIAAGLGVLVLVLMISAQVMTRAVVNIVLNEKTVAKDVTLTLDPKIATSNPEKLILKAEVVTTEVAGERDAMTTGKKIIGEKAKGKVTLYNRTSSPKIFSAGTVLASNTLKFTLDETVTVASASTGQNFETKPGTAEAAITAAQIGTESNLAKDTDLTIESFAKETYVARTLAGLTGGTSREIQAVSPQDRDRLAVALRKDLMNRATEQFKQEGGSGRFIIPTNKSKVLNASYSAEIGKETDHVSLDLRLQVEGLAYQAGDLKPLAQVVLTSELPPGYQLSDAEPQILSSPVESSTTSAVTTLQVNLSAPALPQLSEDEVKTAVAGLPMSTAQEKLGTRSEVKSAEIQLFPRFFTLFFKTIPKQLERITVQLEPKQ